MDIVCLSHLRWEFVYQRPNHLMARAARRHRVHFIEEPTQRADVAKLEVRLSAGVRIVRPVLPSGLTTAQAEGLQAELLRNYLRRLELVDAWLWYYTPMALRWTEPLPAAVIVYDCMDELSAFRDAPLELRRLERELLARADLVFTGGRSLYEAKCRLHPRTHLFPSSVDTAHFGQAREPQPEPADQAAIARPRIGYFGVIDERLDLKLVADVAASRPEWQLVMVGPVTKIDEAELPRATNLHWLRAKPYAELPAYLAGWDVAIMPFAINEATRFISPTKTPEYLAGGRPVVSTPVRDVVQPYGDAGLVAIAPDTASFVAAIERQLESDRTALLRRADQLLAGQSWDRTWSDMEQLVLAQHRRRLTGVASRSALPGAASNPPERTGSAPLAAELSNAALGSPGSSDGA